MRMKNVKLAIAFLAFAALCCGQDKPVAEKPVPHITAEQQLAYFQAKADLTEAQARAVDAQKRMDDAVKVMQAVCPLVLDEKQRPQCAPEPPKPVEKSKPTEK